MHDRNDDRRGKLWENKKIYVRNRDRERKKERDKEENHGGKTVYVPKNIETLCTCHVIPDAIDYSDEGLFLTLQQNRLFSCMDVSTCRFAYDVHITIIAYYDFLHFYVRIYNSLFRHTYFLIFSNEIIISKLYLIMFIMRFHEFFPISHPAVFYYENLIR